MATNGRIPTFAALDFETANYDAASVCAIGVVRVERGVITARRAELVRPSPSGFRFTHIHGIRARDVARAPGFTEAWRAVMPLLEGVAFVAAHNASFERRVLEACAARFGLPVRIPAMQCTVKLARETWNLYPTKLPDVASYLRIDLRHHDALSDAEACARIVIAARGGRSAARQLRVEL